MPSSSKTAIASTNPVPQIPVGSILPIVEIQKLIMRTVRKNKNK